MQAGGMPHILEVFAECLAIFHCNFLTQLTSKENVVKTISSAKYIPIHRYYFIPYTKKVSYSFRIKM